MHRIRPNRFLKLLFEPVKTNFRKLAKNKTNVSLDKKLWRLPNERESRCSRTNLRNPRSFIECPHVFSMVSFLNKCIIRPLRVNSFSSCLSKCGGSSLGFSFCCSPQAPVFCFCMSFAIQITFEITLSGCFIDSSARLAVSLAARHGTEI